MIRLCAFADEAGTTLEEQITALKKHRISLIEIRSIDKKTFHNLPTTKQRNTRVFFVKTG